MSAVLQMEKVSSVVQKSYRRDPIILTSRDYEIISFLLEMKFAGLDEVHAKFFSKLKSGEKSESNIWARERLTKLTNNGFLDRSFSFYERKSIFVATLKGYYALRSFEENHNLLLPARSINLNTYNHDKLVLQERLALEESEEVTNWISDRRLKSDFSRLFKVSSVYVPDGIYTTQLGTKIAFELELARKSKTEYRNKIRTYVQLMRDHKSHPEMFQKVHYLCFSKAVADILRAETKIYGELFEIEERSLKANPN